MVNRKRVTVCYILRVSWMHGEIAQDNQSHIYTHTHITIYIYNYIVIVIYVYMYVCMYVHANCIRYYCPSRLFFYQSTTSYTMTLYYTRIIPA